ncbi:MAG: S-layer homology domain-containing protein [Candidatus Cohnella colombiensis]|uniref:S-layer homology domain-containing protein n=1 Tax=Candidatus Cohnella colombiensis TaxID=3121368 RepID=A0AA95EY84_9BACL|nr:MAG: S-layer homology domain-containing protein [Cohnella sp.]
MRQIRSIVISILVVCLAFTAGVPVSEAAGRGKIGFASDITGSPGDTITVKVYVDMTMVSESWELNPSVGLEGYGTAFSFVSWGGWVQDGNQERHFRDLKLKIAEDAVQGVYQITINRENTLYQLNGVDATSYDTFDKTITVLGYTVAPIADQTLSPLIEGYDSGSQETIPIDTTRTGSGNLANLQAQLSGANANDFVVTQPQPNMLNTVGDAASFSVKAIDGLTPGTYTATVTVSADRMAAGATFSVTQVVYQRLSITSHPQDQLAKEGDDASFGVTATGGSPTYQWQEDTGEGFSNMAGQNGATLNLSAVTGDMSGRQYRVVVATGDGQTDTSNAAQLTVKNVPGTFELLGASGSDGKVTLTWTPSSGATVYKVYKSETAGNYAGAEERTVAANVYEYEWSGLTNGATYYFKVKAENEVGDNTSNEKSATPQVPAPGVPVLGLATPGDARISLTWDPVIGSTGYKIFKSTTSGTYGSEEASVSGSVYGYDVTGLTNGTKYYFVIKATNPGGDSTASNEVIATPRTVPSAPTGVTAVAGNGHATVSFTTPANGGSDITYYEVTAMPGNITVTGTGSPITVTGLSNGVAYSFTVQAVNSAGSSVASDASNSVTPRRPSDSSMTSTPSPTPATPSPTVDVFNSSIVNEANLVQTIESKAAEAKEANAAMDFADAQGHWAEKTIDIFVQLNLINGYKDGTFRPNSPITRAEFATILNRAFHIQGGSNTSVVLKDIDATWAKDDIENLVVAGVINGYTDGTFKPNQTITREEMTVMLSRIVNLNSLEKDTAKGHFSDLSDAYAVEEIQVAAQAGIVSGKGDGRFDPKSDATRAEALQMILNVLKLNPQLKTLLDSLA